MIIFNRKIEKILFILFYLSIISTRTNAQRLFVKTYNFGTVENSYQIVMYNGRLFINTATFCGAECSYLTEIDSLGNILWKTDVPDIDIASGTMVIVHDTITTTGNNDPSNTLFRMAHFTLDGEKRGPTFEIEHPIEKYTNMFQLTLTYFSGKFVLSGSGRQGGIRKSLIFVANQIGIVDTLVALEPTDGYSVIWDSSIDQQGRLTTYHQVEFAHSEVNYRKIFKFDSSFDTVWTYTSEFNDHNYIIPYGCELADGRQILTFVNPQGSPVLYSVRAINADGTVDWQHDYPTTGTQSRYILRLKCLSNGDILGSGQFGDLNQSTDIYGAPWLFRMSPEGELLWERAYIEIDSNTMQARVGSFFDFVELENGDLLAVGNLKYDDDDMLIMRVDSNGCLYPDDCNLINVITAAEIPPITQNKFNVYPNPASTILHIQIPDFFGKFNYSIYNSTGQCKISGSITSNTSDVHVDDLPTGLYFLTVHKIGKLIGTKRFVKVGD